jgi:hypothetical protein
VIFFSRFTSALRFSSAVDSAVAVPETNRKPSRSLSVVDADAVGSPEQSRETLQGKKTWRGATTVLAVGAIATTLFVVAAGEANAATPGPGWTLDSFALPTNFSPDHDAGCLANFQECDAYQLTATEVGSQPTDGSAVTLTDMLPPGLTVQSITFVWTGAGAMAAGLDGQDLASFGLCTTTPAPSSTPVQCQLDNNGFGLPPIAPDDRLQMVIHVSIDDPGASGPLTNSATISGGGAADASATEHHQISSGLPAFGATAFSSYIAGADGAPDTQAGDHPYELTTRIDLANAVKLGPEGVVVDNSVEDPRNVVVDLPLGFVGSALAAPTCTMAQLSSQDHCPTASSVGHIRTEPPGLGVVDSPIYNIVPEQGVAAEFGFYDALLVSHFLYARVVPGPDGYVLQVTSPDIPSVNLYDVVATFFGSPADHPGQPTSGQTPVAMFTNPSHCDGQPLTTTMHMDSWQHPGSTNPDGTPDLADPNWVTATDTSPPVTGCNQLQFHPTISVKPDSSAADSPSGLDVELKVPQSTDPNTLATPPLKKGVVTLPQGITINPAAADGLGACSPAQIDLSSADPPNCPDSSKVGTVELQSPLLPGTLHGSIFLATQHQNPFDALLAGYIVVDDPDTGVVIKIPGRLDTDPSTGQITGTFDNNPQFPFSDLRLHFFGGNRGELATPTTCGTYHTTSELTPWSAPDSGPPATPSDSFTIDSGPNGGPCVSSDAQRPLAPGFSAGTISPGAGSYSPFVLKLTRQDGEQNLVRLDTTLPPGLLGKLAGIPECSDAQLASISTAEGTGINEQNNPACPAGSLLGSSSVGAGAGTPFYVGGKIYLAGPYKGAPYSVAIVTPVLAGPFDFGSIVVRAALYVDPATAQITARSDAIPTLVQGIPLRIRDIRVKLDRPDFTLNPTSCDPMTVTGTAFGSDGAQAPLSDRFQVGGCAGLPFAPKFSAQILNGAQGIHRSDHPNLVFNLHANPGDANVRMAQVTLPPSFQIDQANLGNICSETELATSNCAGRNTVGTATATTPLLDYQLQGPVYAVSGSGGLPKLAVILDGPPTQPVHLVLRGITTTIGNRIANTFATVPDAPVTDFSLTLKGGPTGYLVNNTNVCAGAKGRSQKAKRKAKKLRKTNLTANALIEGQNGKTADQRIPIAAQCPKQKKKGRRAKHRQH